jgi:hypothetical protein
VRTEQLTCVHTTVQLVTAVTAAAAVVRSSSKKWCKTAVLHATWERQELVCGNVSSCSGLCWSMFQRVYYSVSVQLGSAY